MLSVAMLVAWRDILHTTDVKLLLPISHKTSKCPPIFQIQKCGFNQRQLRFWIFGGISRGWVHPWGCSSSEQLEDISPAYLARNQPILKNAAQILALAKWWKLRQLLLEHTSKVQEFNQVYLPSLSDVYTYKELLVCLCPLWKEPM